MHLVAGLRRAVTRLVRGLRGAPERRLAFATWRGAGRHPELTAAQLLEQMSQAVALLDGELRLVCASAPFRELYRATLRREPQPGESLVQLCQRWGVADQLSDLPGGQGCLEQQAVELPGPGSARRTLELSIRPLRRARAADRGPGEPRLLLVVEEITERRRSEELLRARLLLSELAHSHSLDHVLTKTLDMAERLTGGSIGFFHFLDDDESTLSLQSWSTNTLGSLCTAEGRGQHYPVEQAGVWADCVRQRRPVIHNDLRRVSGRKGVPAGHADVLRELLIPVFRGGKVVAILGTGNKPTDYDERDVEDVSALANLAWDIVLYKRSEEALRCSERDLAMAQQVAHVGSWQLDLRTEQLHWTDEVFRIFGLEPQSFVPTLQGFLERIHPDDRGRVERAYRRAVAEAAPYEVVHRVVRPDGEVRMVRERARQLTDQAGKVVRSLGTVLDVTELVLAQQELERANLELEQRVQARTAELDASKRELERLNAQKNLLLGMAAHDLRNPLAVIQGFAGLLSEGGLGQLTTEQVRVLGRIRSSSQYMLKLVNDLIDLSAIEAGSLELHRVPEDLLALVQDALSANQLLATPKEIRLELVQADTLPPIPLDRTRVEQVLNNLLGNAIKYSPAGGQVEVSLQHTPGEAVLCVRDHGRGIAPDVIASLFRAFGTAGAPGTGGERATGLGLAIAARMVQAHGGRIWVESTPGQGASFFVGLPLAPEQVVQHSEPVVHG